MFDLEIDAHLEVTETPFESDMDRANPDRFEILRLNKTPNSWCVIEMPLGAIALNEHGALIFRLSVEQARAIADRLNRALKDGGPLH